MSDTDIRITFQKSSLGHCSTWLKHRTVWSCTCVGVWVSYREAEVATAWAAVMFDHMRAMSLTQHHERDTAGWTHRLPFYHRVGTAHKLKIQRDQAEGSN